MGAGSSGVARWGAREWLGEQMPQACMTELWRKPAGRNCGHRYGERVGGQVSGAAYRLDWRAGWGQPLRPTHPRPVLRPNPAPTAR